MGYHLNPNPTTYDYFTQCSFEHPDPNPSDHVCQRYQVRYPLCPNYIHFVRARLRIGFCKRLSLRTPWMACDGLSHVDEVSLVVAVVVVGVF